MCPKCGETLIIIEWEGIEIDYCLSCGGTWLDEGELEMMTALENAEPGELTDALYQKKSQKRSEFPCPRCRKKMDQIQVGEPPIVLERCHHGHGLWFDEGEVTEIIQHFHDDEEKRVAQFFSRLYQNRLKNQTEGE